MPLGRPRSLSADLAKRVRQSAPLAGTLRAIANGLNEDGVPTVHGCEVARLDGEGGPGNIRRKNRCSLLTTELFANGWNQSTTFCTQCDSLVRCDPYGSPKTERGDHMEKTLLTVAELGARLQCSRTTAYELVGSRRVRAVRLTPGGTIRVGRGCRGVLDLARFGRARHSGVSRTRTSRPSWAAHPCCLIDSRRRVSF